MDVGLGTNMNGDARNSGGLGFDNDPAQAAHLFHIEHSQG